jgi:hypothetical protein
MEPVQHKQRGFGQRKTRAVVGRCYHKVAWLPNAEAVALDADDTPVPIPVDDAIRNMPVIEAIRLSSETTPGNCCEISAGSIVQNHCSVASEECYVAAREMFQGRAFCTTDPSETPAECPAIGAAEPGRHGAVLGNAR